MKIHRYPNTQSAFNQPLAWFHCILPNKVKKLRPSKTMMKPWSARKRKTAPVPKIPEPEDDDEAVSDDVPLWTIISRNKNPMAMLYVMTSVKSIHPRYLCGEERGLLGGEKYGGGGG